MVMKSQNVGKTPLPMQLPYTYLFKFKCPEYLLLAKCEYMALSFLFSFRAPVKKTIVSN